MEELFNNMNEISVVVPVYNEELIILELSKRIKNSVETITEDYEIILIDDGSSDRTWENIILETKKNNKLKGLRLSRNFGQHYAITAGLDNCVGKWTVVMDGDLQDRPEVIPELFAKVQEGFDIVFVSRKNRPERLYYKVLQKTFYVLLRFFSGIKFDSSQANFSIISRNVVDSFKLFPENARFYGSIIKWLGFKRSKIWADHGSRFEGKPSYTFRSRLRLAIDVILVFSERPLKILSLIGILSSLIFVTTLILGFLGVNTFRAVIYDTTYTNIFIIIAIVFNTTFFAIFAVYIQKIFNQIKNRPIYIISERI
jgi:glycosyltransferase involved in cell wall biosynthesis